MALKGVDRMKLLAAGAALLLALGGAACSGLGTAPDRSESTSAPDQLAGADMPQDAVPQTVNVFGELNGADARPWAPAGDAGYQQHTFLDEGYDSEEAVDPTGKYLVFASTRHSEHPQIYLQKVDGAAVTQLTNEAADDAYPAFSPDGRQIAFCSTRGGNWQIYLMDVDGRNVVQVTSGPMQAVHPSFSPDGARLVYASLSARSNQWELWTINLQTNEKKMIGYGLFPSWSPARDMDRIAFQRARQRGSRWFSLWTMELVNGEGRRMTEVAASSNAAILTPAWSPDGRRIAFATVGQPAPSGAARLKGQTDIWEVDADGGNRQRLTDGTATNLMPFWAGDNRIYFISDRAGAETVWSVRADAGTPLTAEAGPAAAPMAPAPNAKPDQVGTADAGEVER